MKRLALPVWAWRGMWSTSRTVTRGSGTPALRRLSSRVAASAVRASSRSRTTATSAPALGLADLVFAYRGRFDHHGADRERVHLDAAVSEGVVGSSFSGRSQVTVVGGTGVANQSVRELVADQRLGEVVEVGHQCFGRCRARLDGFVVAVDELDDAHVAGEAEDRSVGLGVADETLGGGELIGHGDAERGADGRAVFGAEHLGRGGDGRGRDP